MARVREPVGDDLGKLVRMKMRMGILRQTKKPDMIALSFGFSQ
jgi:hypothetical protein